MSTFIHESGGESLDYHSERKVLNNDAIIEIITCVYSNLINIHHHTHIYRDIKPGNIVITKAGEAKHT